MYVVKKVDSTLQSPEFADNKSSEIYWTLPAQSQYQQWDTPRSPLACQSAHNLQKSDTDQERDTHI